RLFTKISAEFSFPNTECDIVNNIIISNISEFLMLYTYRISKVVGKTLHSEYMIFLPSESIFPNRPSGVPGYPLRTYFFE
ncbi:TPA: hypothetical protein ACNBMY_004640, partial [Escherichia coli]